MILVSGASGNAGGAVLQEVLKSNRPLKAMYRSPEDAAKASAEVGAVIADFADKPSLGRALDGVDAVYPRACGTRRQYGGCLSGSRRASCGSELRAGSRRLSEVLPELAPQSRRQARGIWPRLHNSTAEQLYAEHRDVLRTHHQDPGRILCRHGMLEPALSMSAMLLRWQQGR